MELEYETDEMKEKGDNIMQLNIDNYVLEIPENLLIEMEQILHFDTREKMIEEITISANALKNCFTEKELKNKSLNDRLIEYLESEINFFK